VHGRWRAHASPRFLILFYLSSSRASHALRKGRWTPAVRKQTECVHAWSSSSQTWAQSRKRLHLRRNSEVVVNSEW